jgi:hypothetical protein
MSLQTLAMAVSQLWLAEYADCNGSFSPLIVMWFFNLAATTLSMSLERYERFDMGRKFLRMEGSSVAFFRRGVIIAIFSSLLIFPVERERLTMAVITGRRWSMQDFSNQVGSGSRLEDLAGDFMMSWWISVSEAGGRVSRSMKKMEFSFPDLFAPSFDLMSSIFLMK